MLSNWYTRVLNVWVVLGESKTELNILGVGLSTVRLFPDDLSYTDYLPMTALCPERRWLVSTVQRFMPAGQNHYRLRLTNQNTGTGLPTGVNASPLQCGATQVGSVEFRAAMLRLALSAQHDHKFSNETFKASLAAQRNRQLTRITAEILIRNRTWRHRLQVATLSGGCDGLPSSPFTHNARDLGRKLITQELVLEYGQKSSQNGDRHGMICVTRLYVAHCSVTVMHSLWTLRTTENTGTPVRSRANRNWSRLTSPIATSVTPSNGETPLLLIRNDNRDFDNLNKKAQLISVDATDRMTFLLLLFGFCLVF